MNTELFNIELVIADDVIFEEIDKISEIIYRKKVKNNLMTTIGVVRGIIKRDEKYYLRCDLFETSLPIITKELNVKWVGHLRGVKVFSEELGKYRLLSIKDCICLKEGEFLEEKY